MYGIFLFIEFQFKFDQIKENQQNQVILTPYIRVAKIDLL